jgi:hypothetical protein
MTVTRPILQPDCDAQFRLQTLLSQMRQAHGAALVLLYHPTRFLYVCKKVHPKRPAQVSAAFRPIEASNSGIRLRTAAQTALPQPIGAPPGQRNIPSLSTHDELAAKQRFKNSYRHLPRQMLIAATCEPKFMFARRFRNCPLPRRGHRQGCHGFQRIPNALVGYSVIPVFALTLHRNEPGFDQLTEMKTRRLRRHVTKKGEFARRQCASIHQGHQHRGAYRVTNHRTGSSNGSFHFHTQF